MLSRNILVGASALILVLGVAGAQAASRKHQPGTHSAASLACSQQANEKGLHGKVRKKFREACKRQYSKNYGYSPKQAGGYQGGGYQGGGYQPQQGQAYKPMQDQGYTPSQNQGYKAYKPQQDQGYKAPQGQGYKQPQQGQGGNNPMKWW